MSADVVQYEVRDEIALVTMNRPRYRNAQNSAMTYALDDAFSKAAADDAVRVILLRGQGDHFSAGHDIGTPDRDHARTYPRTATMWWDHVGKDGAESRYAREHEVYLGMCRRWRDLPKPTIAVVQGACIAGGLMLAWSCDLIIASEDAYFSDPVVRMGIPGVEFFAHPWVLGPRRAKAFLYLGSALSATDAQDIGMVHDVTSRDGLDQSAVDLAKKIATMPRLGLALTKRAVNHAEDLMGMRDGMEAVFGLHHLAHAHNAEISDDSLGGHTAASMRDANEAARS